MSTLKQEPELDIEPEIEPEPEPEPELEPDPEPESNLKRRPLNGESKELIFKFAKWWENDNPKPYLRMCAKKRVGDVLGISGKSIYKIFKDLRNEGTFRGPKKLHRIRSRRSKFDDTFYEEVVRSAIYDFHIWEKKLPTVKTLIPVLKEKIDFQGKRENLRMMLIKLGFQNCKMPQNKKTWKEKLEVVNKRTNYLKKITQYRLQGRPIVYTDETYILSSNNESNDSAKPPSRFVIIHAGTEDSLIPNVILIYKLTPNKGIEISFNQYYEWVSAKLIPNLERNSVVVIDNKSYHNKSAQKVPKPNTRKENMKNWLKKKDIAFPENCLKAELYDLVLKNKPQNQSYIINDLLEDHGHTVLRLPPHHPELNSLKKFGALIKSYVTSYNEEFSIEKLKDLVVEIINNINHEWKNVCQHVKQCEEEYRQKDFTMDNIYESYPTMTTNDSSTSDISSDDE